MTAFHTALRVKQTHKQRHDSMESREGGRQEQRLTLLGDDDPDQTSE